MSTVVPIDGIVGVQLMVSEPPPETVPYEIQSFITPEAFQARMRAVLRKGSRYCRPGFDYAWMALSFLAAIVVPIAVYFIAFNALPHNNQDNINNDEFFPYGEDDDGRYWKARLIAFASFIGVQLLTWIPMLAWKLHGKSSVNAMLQKFEAEDRAVREPGAPVPTYRLAMPGIGSRVLNVIITVPRTQVTASFQPGVQLPSYVVNPPTDPSIATAYGYGSQGYGAPAYDKGYGGSPPGQYNVPLQSVPLYNEFDEKVPAYSGPTELTYTMVDEKLGFEDVKV